MLSNGDSLQLTFRTFKERKANERKEIGVCARAAYEALSAEKKQAALDRARQMFLEAGADDVLLNIEQLPAWIQANN